MINPTVISEKKIINLNINDNNTPTQLSLLKYINCTFKTTVSINNLNRENLNLEFINCKFNGDLNIIASEIRSLKLIWDFENKKKDTCHIKSKFDGNEIIISHNIFHGFCEIKGLNHIIGKFHFIKNNFIEKPQEFFTNRKTEHAICKINNNNLHNSSFQSNTYYMPFEFIRNVLTYDTEYRGNSFHDNIFHKADFTRTDFGIHTSFYNSKFYSTTVFIKCINFDTDFSYISFSSCLFKGYTLFDKSNFNHFEIEHSMFERKASFDLMTTKTLKFHQVTFLQGAFFDDLRIINVENRKYLKKVIPFKAKEWRRTLRLIKQELLKAENKIDSNRFRNYELAIHYKELKFKENFKDTFILWATRWSTNFGNWVWALGFTILSGLFWYSILYGFKSTFGFECEESKAYFSGAFRFFLVTDFYSPFNPNRVYLKDIIYWIPFVFGKIVIAFGIYEMIQAFRKFKA